MWLINKLFKLFRSEWPKSRTDIDRSLLKDSLSQISDIWDIFFKEVPNQKQLNFVKLRFHFLHRWKTDSESQNSLFNLRRTWHKSFLWYFLPRVNLRLRAVLFSQRNLSHDSKKKIQWKKKLLSARRASLPELRAAGCYGCWANKMFCLPKFTRCNLLLLQDKSINVDGK